jgi:hypothetical protein
MMAVAGSTNEGEDEELISTVYRDLPNWSNCV